MIDLSKFHSIVFDFDGVFTDNYAFVDENAIESVRVSRADGYGIDLLRKFCSFKGLELSLLILSSERNKVVSARASKLKLECISGETNKLQALKRRFLVERPHDEDPLSGLIYFGNDLNDLSVMLEAGISLAPSDAHVKIKEISTHVLSCPGGQGFVREGVELILNIDSMSTEEIREFISHR